MKNLMILVFLLGLLGQIKGTEWTKEEMIVVNHNVYQGNFTK